MNVDEFRLEQDLIKLDTLVAWGRSRSGRRGTNNPTIWQPERYDWTPIWSKPDLDESGIAIGVATSATSLRAWVIRSVPLLTNVDVIGDSAGVWQIETVEVIGRKRLFILTASFFAATQRFPQP